MGVVSAGSVFAGYRIEAMLAEGGMGAVYKARQLSLERTVALKVIAAPMASDPQFRERFRREALAAAAIDHPHVVPVFEADESEGLLFLAMRLVDGIDLASLIDREGQLDPERAVRIVGQIASALDAAHERGLVHRDVKPANILVSEQAGRPDHSYLTDFGIAPPSRRPHRVDAPGDGRGNHRLHGPGGASWRAGRTGGRRVLVGMRAVRGPGRGDPVSEGE